MVTLSNDYNRLSRDARKHLFHDRHMIVDGKETPAICGEMISVIGPGNGEAVGRVPSADADDIDRAIGAARKAFDEEPWPYMPPGERERVMLRLVDLVERNREAFAEIETVESGRVFGMSLISRE